MITKIRKYMVSHEKASYFVNLIISIIFIGIVLYFVMLKSIWGFLIGFVVCGVG